MSSEATPAVRVMENGNGATRRVDAYRSECAYCDWASPMLTGRHLAAAALDDHVDDEHVVDTDPRSAGGAYR